MTTNGKEGVDLITDLAQQTSERERAARAGEKKVLGFCVCMAGRGSYLNNPLHAITPC